METELECEVISQVAQCNENIEIKLRFKAMKLQFFTMKI